MRPAPLPDYNPIGNIITGFRLRLSMAKRRSAGKIQPAPQTLVFDLPSGVSYIDLSQCASMVNRRFYRQGLNWAVSGFKVFGQAGQTGSVSVGKIQNTWMVSNAWEKVFRTWKRQQDQAIAESGSQSAVAKFRDFKIHMDPAHVDAGFAANLIPFDFTLTGEWDASEIVIPNLTPDASGSEVDPKQYLLHMHGDNNHGGLSRGMVSGYADSRSVPQSPDPVSPPVALAQNWLREMFDVGNDTSEIVDNAVDHNDELPYDQMEYPGADVQAPLSQNHDAVAISATTIGLTTNLMGGSFPCGLIKLNVVATDGAFTPVLYVHLVPGASRGYLTQPMTDM